MISHKHKCIFIHIPKCAGTSINFFLFPEEKIHWFDANYEVVHGWCPQRKFFMQHATSKQLVETGLVTQEQWETYFKFTFVRNPWDRAVSDYFWLMKDQKVEGTFNQYLNRSGEFAPLLNDIGAKYYRGDHLIPQSDFFSEEGIYKMDFVGRFENFSEDMNKVVLRLGYDKEFDMHVNKGINRTEHYSKLFTDESRDIVASLYAKDIQQFGYTFDDQRTIFDHF